MASTLPVLKISKGLFARWVEELGITWLGVLLFTVIPAVLFASAIFSFCVLAAAVLIGIPSVLFDSAKQSSESRGLRRLAVILVVPALTLAYVSKVDEQIPVNAAPLAQTIESFRRDTGRYPESLEVLIPEHFTELPNVRFSVVQPRITYRFSDGKPYLAIPSAMGDMFAQFEYDFEARVWKHQS